jgi:tetratricopeptide (TPR) repeat protein
MSGRFVWSALLAIASLSFEVGGARADTLEDVFRAGNEAYFHSEYADAIERYENLVELGVRDADVFYNLGLAYERQGRHGGAIASFERALRMRPGDDGVRRALESSREAAAEQRAEREGEATVASGPGLGEALFGGVSEDVLAWAVLSFDALFFTVLAGFLFVRRETARLVLGIAAPLLGIALTLSGIGLAVRSGAFDEGVPAVIVMDRSTLREGPRAGAGERGVAREGERAWIMGRDQDWVRVQVGNREGWIEAERVVAIE